VSEYKFNPSKATELWENSRIPCRVRIQGTDDRALAELVMAKLQGEVQQFFQQCEQHWELSPLPFIALHRETQNARYDYMNHIGFATIKVTPKIETFEVLLPEIPEPHTGTLIIKLENESNYKPYRAATNILLVGKEEDTQNIQFNISIELYNEMEIWETEHIPGTLKPIVDYYPEEVWRPLTPWFFWLGNFKSTAKSLTRETGWLGDVIYAESAKNLQREYYDYLVVDVDRLRKLLALRLAIGNNAKPFEDPWEADKYDILFRTEIITQPVGGEPLFLFNKTKFIIASGYRAGRCWHTHTSYYAGTDTIYSQTESNRLVVTVYSYTDDDTIYPTYYPWTSDEWFAWMSAQGADTSAEENSRFDPEPYGQVMKTYIALDLYNNCGQGAPPRYYWKLFDYQPAACISIPPSIFNPALDKCQEESQDYFTGVRLEEKGFDPIYKKTWLDPNPVSYTALLDGTKDSLSWFWDSLPESRDDWWEEIPLNDPESIWRYNRMTPKVDELAKKLLRYVKDAQGFDSVEELVPKTEFHSEYEFNPYTGSIEPSSKDHVNVYLRFKPFDGNRETEYVVTKEVT